MTGCSADRRACSKSRLSRAWSESMLPCEFLLEGGPDETNGVDDVGLAACAIRAWGREGARRVRPGGDPRDLDSQGATDALCKKHGGCSRFDAGRQIQLQTDAGDEYVRPPDNAHCAVQQSPVLQDFWYGGSGRKTDRYRRKGETGGGIESFVRILHNSAGQCGRFEAWRSTYAVRQPSRHARCCADRLN